MTSLFDGDADKLNEARQSYDPIIRQRADGLRPKALIGEDPAFSRTGPWHPGALP
ncbi:hypothetical protein [Kitasatospora sp. NPDC091207]|uniref:hypothetical protein n=1 Tax=Kitasatospora sp. NPDC091207 TaxID=3364083 RepID=UPI00381E81C4